MLSKDRRKLLGLLVLTAVAAWIASCTAPGPIKPDDGGGDGDGGICGTPLAVFNPLAGGFGPVGTDTTLDIATWNLEFFPLDLPGDYDCPHPVDVTRQQATANIINTLALDVYAVEEISDPAGFNDMIAMCPNYGAYVSPEIRGCNYQRPAVIYRKDQVTVRSTSLLFTNNDYAFPRSPLQVDLTIRSNGKSYDLHLIVVHLKASTDAESLDRRRQASSILRTYLNEQAAVDSTLNYMIAGDWNDQIEDPIAFSAFPDFINDPDNFQFLNFPLVTLSGYGSIGTNGAVIDHLLVNRAACPDFAGGRVTTLRLDTVVAGYNNVSDHRPVMVQAPIFR